MPSGDKKFSSIYNFSSNQEQIMSQRFIELRNRIITDDGQVVAKYSLLRKLVFDGKPISGLLALPNEDISKYNAKTPQGEVRIYEEGEPSGPLEESYQWNLPQSYLNLDITEICAEALIEKNLHEDEKYVERLSVELELMQDRDMFDFVRALIYVRDQFRKNNIVKGVGRGSSCASLIMFLLRINLVDPVLYDIPLEEFFKPGMEE